MNQREDALDRFFFFFFKLFMQNPFVQPYPLQHLQIVFLIEQRIWRVPAIAAVQIMQQRVGLQ